MTYGQWYPRYIQLYKSRLAPRTREEYDRIHRQYIAPVLGALELGSITPEDVQLVLVTAADRGGTRQAQTVYSLMHAVFRRAYRSCLVNRSPVDAIDKPEHDPEQGRQLTEQDYAAALPFIRRSLALSLALDAGLRRGEISGLQWQDVDLQHGYLHVRRQRQRTGGQIIIKTPKSASGCRDVAIAPELLQLLKRHYQLIPSGWVVPHAPEYAGRIWADLQSNTLRLSDHYRLHDLRHTYGSRLILDGVNLRAVQYLMGHSSLEVTTRVYSHCSPEQAAREVRRIYAARL